MTVYRAQSGNVFFFLQILGRYMYTRANRVVVVVAEQFEHLAAVLKVAGSSPTLTKPEKLSLFTQQ